MTLLFFETQQSPKNVERADHLAKSGSKQLQPYLPPLTRKPKPCSDIAKNVNGKEPLETTTPFLTLSIVWQDMNRPQYSGCEQDTVACERTWGELASWTLHSAIAKKRNRRSTTSSRTVPSGGNRDTSYGCRMSQPPTSCGEWWTTCTAPPNSWQHVDWGSKHGWSTAEEEEPKKVPFPINPLSLEYDNSPLPSRHKMWHWWQKSSDNNNNNNNNRNESRNSRFLQSPHCATN